MASLGATLKGILSLLVGLRITGKEFLRPTLTTHYPRKEVANLASFRGHIDLVGRDDAPAVPRCIMCGRCMELCPSGCISLGWRLEDGGTGGGPLLLAPGLPLKGSTRREPPAGPLGRELVHFRLSYTYCSLCGLCVQNCPAGALEFSREAYLAGTARGDFQFDLLARLRTRAAAPGARAHAA